MSNLAQTQLATVVAIRAAMDAPQAVDILALYSQGLSAELLERDARICQLLAALEEARLHVISAQRVLDRISKGSHE